MPNHANFGVVPGGFALVYAKAEILDDSLQKGIDYLHTKHLEVDYSEEIESSEFYETAIEDEHDLIHFQKANLYGVALHVTFFSVPDGETVQ